MSIRVGREGSHRLSLTNVIGSKGENLAHVRLTRFINGAPLFEPYLLDGKYPAVDYIVVLRNTGSETLFFFAQVKSTLQGYTSGEHRLKVGVSEEETKAIIGIVAPTYIIGVDLESELAYIVSANGENTTSMSSMCTSYLLNDATCRILWDEVRAFWKPGALPKLDSSFTDSTWR